MEGDKPGGRSPSGLVRSRPATKRRRGRSGSDTSTAWFAWPATGSATHLVRLATRKTSHSVPFIASTAARPQAGSPNWPIATTSGASWRPSPLKKPSISNVARGGTSAVAAADARRGRLGRRRSRGRRPGAGRGPRAESRVRRAVGRGVPAPVRPAGGRRAAPHRRLEDGGIRKRRDRPAARLRPAVGRAQARRDPSYLAWRGHLDSGGP